MGNAQLKPEGTGIKTTKMCLMHTCQYATLSYAKY